MSINWGGLTPIAAPQVVAQLPAAGPSQTDTLAGGIMQGLAQGSSIRANQQSIAESQQRMDQAKQLFPGQQQIQQQTIQSNQQTIDSNTRATQTAAEMKTQFNAGWDQGMQWMQKNDPAGYTKLQVDQADYAQKMGAAAKSSADANAQQLKNFDQMAITGSNLANEAMNGRTPEEQNQIYQMRLNQLKSMSPQLASVFPQQFDQSNYMLLTKAGHDALVRQKEADEAKNNKPSDKMQQAQRIALLQNKIKNGTATSVEQDELTSLQQQTKPTQMIASPADKVKTNTTTKYLEQRDTIKSVSVNNLNALNMMGKLSDQALSGAGAEANLAIQKAISAVTGQAPDPKVPITESLTAFAKTYQISQQVLMKGSSSERDMDLLAQTGPQINNTAQGRKLMANQLGYKETMTIQQVDFDHSWANQHNADMTGAQDAWNAFVESRADFNPKTMVFDKMPTNKDWQPFLDSNYKPPKQSNFIEGQKYKDKNGNEARYVNGKWEKI